MFLGENDVSGSSNILRMFDEGPECRRQWPRQLMLLAARLVTIGGDLNVRVRDVSPGGARLEGANLPRIGKDAVLRRGRFEAFGTIVWAGSSQAGIAFDQPLEPEDMMRLAEAPDLPSIEPVVVRRPGFGRRAAPGSQVETGWR